MSTFPSGWRQYPIPWLTGSTQTVHGVADVVLGNVGQMHSSTRASVACQFLQTNNCSSNQHLPRHLHSDTGQLSSVVEPLPQVDCEGRPQWKFPWERTEHAHQTSLFRSRRLHSSPVMTSPPAEAWHVTYACFLSMFLSDQALSRDLHAVAWCVLSIHY